MEDKVDIHHMDKYYERAKDRLSKDSSLHPENQKLILQYLRDSELGKTIKKGQKKKIDSGRNLRTAGILKLMDAEWFKKPFEDVTVKDMENFILKLEKGKITSNRGTPFKSETQKTIKKFIRKFWKWMKGNGTNYPEEVDWIDTSGKDADIRALPKLRKDVEKMVDLAPDFLKKAMIMTLFDSGTREGEFLNLRIGDVDESEDKTLYIRVRHSKTFGRRIGLPIATDYLKEWMQQHPRKDIDDAMLWEHEINYTENGRERTKIVPVSKAYFYNNIKRIGEKALKMQVTPQMMRHTSATHYATLLDRASFCKRFGWSFASKMPDRYIDWAGIQEENAVKVIQATDINTMKYENKLLREEMSRIKEKIQMIEIQRDNNKLIVMEGLNPPKRTYTLLRQAIEEAGIPKNQRDAVAKYFVESRMRYDDNVLGLNGGDISGVARKLRQENESGRLHEAIQRWEKSK